MQAKHTPLTLVERNLCKKLVGLGTRLDGRGLLQLRRLQLSFTRQRGGVDVELGATRVLAQCSCDIVSPLAQRPNEGLLSVGVHLTPLSAPIYESGKHPEQASDLQRILERCLRDSRAIDLESLCIIHGEKVWQLRLDIHVLNDDGNICDCASIAALLSLAHFRRPDVSVSGDKITVYSSRDRQPIGLHIQHWPLCLTQCYIDGAVLLDPSKEEEQIQDGNIIIAVNNHLEICGIHMCGGVLLDSAAVLQSAHRVAGLIANEIIPRIKNALDVDESKRVCPLSASSLQERKLNKEHYKTNALLIQKGGDVADDVSIEKQTEDVIHPIGGVTSHVEFELESEVINVVPGGRVKAIVEGGNDTWTIAEEESEVSEFPLNVDHNIEDNMSEDEEAAVTI